MHVAIIGAGAAGLASARHATDPAYNFTCEIFEQMDELGGTWVYTEETDVDQYGIQIHTSMYKGLRTNLPKEIMHFVDFKFPNYPNSYITQEQVLKYLHDYADHFKLRQFIKYRHQVKRVHPLPENRWSVTVTNLRTNCDTVKEFDAVLVCNGHYSTMYVPDILGKDIFKGLQMHSHKYRRADMFKNKTVLVVGGGPSGIDILIQLIPFASKIVFSFKNTKFNAPLASHVFTKPETIELTEHDAIFMDGTSESIDVIIYCTGYKYDFPFLTNECGIKVEKNFVQPLYKHVINIEKPTMAFIGLVFLVIPFPVFDFQIRLFLKYLKGLIQLPSMENMKLDTENDMNARWNRGYPKHYAHKLGSDFQAQYYADLANIAKVEPFQPVKLNIYANGFKNFNRNVLYKEIDDEKFEIIEIK